MRKRGAEAVERMVGPGSAASARSDEGGGDAVVVGAEQVAEGVRHRIQTSEILPGEWLREARICDDYGVGRSIARRALRILEEDGLLELEENRGARVSATSVQEVFDLFEVRAALYGLAARFACLRGSSASIARMLVMIDQMLRDVDHGAKASDVIGISEAIFSEMAATASPDAQRMIEAIRRKTRWHYSYTALDASSDGPFDHWRAVRAALIARDADAASQAARDILYFMQHEVSRLMLSRGGMPSEPVVDAPAAKAAAPDARTRIISTIE